MNGLNKRPAVTGWQAINDQREQRTRSHYRRHRGRRAPINDTATSPLNAAPAGI
jgi:hypothetical protein